MKNTIVFIVFVLVVVGLLYSVSGKRYAQIPHNAAHQVEDEVAACMTCHGEGKANALSKQHPPKYECFKCHKHSRKR